MSDHRYKTEIRREREAVLSALDDLSQKLNEARADTTDTTGGTFFWGQRAGLNGGLDYALELIDASRSALETPKP